MRRCMVSALILSACFVDIAEGQTAGLAQPSRAIFGGAQARGLQRRPGGLDLVVQLSGGYDDDVLADQSNGGGSDRPRLNRSTGGFSSGLDFGLRYARPGLLYKRPSAQGDFGAWANGSIRHYPSVGDGLIGTYFRTGADLSAPLNRRLTLYARPEFDYSPRYSLQIFPEARDAGAEAQPILPEGTEVPELDGDFSVVQSNSRRYGTAAGARIEVGVHSRLGINYAYTRRESDLASAKVDIQSGGISFAHQFSRTASLQLGYSYREGTHGTGVTTRAHSIDVGVNYRKPLSRTRRTFLRFNTGSVVSDSEVGRRWHAIGAAGLVHHMGRTWTGLAEYRRQLRYADGFDRPIFADVVNGAVSGLISRRMELAFRARYVSGSVGLNRNSPRFDTFSVSARLRRAVTRRLAAYGEYVFYRYIFDEDAVRPVGLPERFNRNAIRLGLSWWIPLVD